MCATRGWESATPTDTRHRRALTPKPSKYGNVKTTVDNIVFDSAKEARRWSELQIMARSGLIRDLTRQAALHLAVPVLEGGMLNVNEAKVTGMRFVGQYLSDFRYFDCATNAWVIEDVKSPATRRTTVYRLKKRMVEAQYCIVIVEV